MITLTTRQRDILRVILDVNRPIGSTELAEMLHLTPRQIIYSMQVRSLKIADWQPLAQQALNCSTAQEVRELVKKQLG